MDLIELPLESQCPRQSKADCALLLALVFIIGLSLFVAIWAMNPAYMKSYRLNANPDARHYLLLGHNFLEKGEYSRNASPPYVPDVLRTPLYPLLAGGLDLLFGGIWAVYLFQVACLAMTVLATYFFTRRIFSRTLALLAGLLLGSDLMLAVLNYEAMSECVYNLLATVAVFCWLGDASSAGRGGIKGAVTIGIVMALAILVRPAGLYLPVLMFAGSAVLSALRRSKREVSHAAIMAIVCYLAVSPWIIRNYVLYQVPRLTTADTINALYFAGASAYALEHNVPLEEAQACISTEYNVAPLAETNNFWLSNRPVWQMDAEQRAASWQVFAAYPRSLAFSTGIGWGKALISHNVGALAYMTDRRWIGQGLDRLRDMRLGDFLSGLAANNAALLAVFAWQELMAIFVLPFAFAGIVTGLGNARTRFVVFGLVFVGAYYLLTIALVGADAYFRHRSMLVPLIDVLAAIGVVNLANAVRHKAKSCDAPEVVAARTCKLDLARKTCRSLGRDWKPWKKGPGKPATRYVRQCICCATVCAS